MESKESASVEVFFDIDGCLIDENYRFTVPVEQFRALVQPYLDKMRLHLNSNRSLEHVIKIWQQLHFNGLLIYENGQGVYDPLKNILLDCSGKPFDKSRLRKSLEGYADDVFFIQTMKLIKHPELLSSDLSKVVYCEETREFTATVYPRTIVDGIPSFDVNYYDRIFELLCDVYNSEYDITPEVAYGNIALTPKTSQKSRPFSKLFPGRRIASFGDNTADIAMFRGSSPGLFGCPANASVDVKGFVRENQGYLSANYYTQGALDFLNYLDTMK